HRRSHGRGFGGDERARARQPVPYERHRGQGRGSSGNGALRGRRCRCFRDLVHGDAPARSLAVLCVEDNPYGPVLLNTLLAERGHRADFVGSGAAAVEAVAQGCYDVVLMDVTLPDFDGVEATRRIRALPGRSGRVPIVGVSGRANAADEAAGRAAGMDGYLT